MKSRANKSKRQNKKKDKPNTSTSELSSFSLAAAISEASTESTSQQQQQQQQPPRKIFSANKTHPSQTSIATNTSFATANESVQQPLAATGTITPTSYFVDSSDEENTEEGLIFGNDPLAVLTRTTPTTAAADSANANDTLATPTEISFSNRNPEETMPSKKSTKTNNFSPVEATPVPAATTAPTKDAPPVVAPATKVAPAEEEAHFDVAQNVYGGAKDVWAWGTTLPVVSNLLGLTEAVAAKVLDVAVHKDLEAIDNEDMKPNLKKLDDDVITPVILAVWKIIEPAVGKTDEMIVKPVMTEVVPRVLGPLGLFVDRKKMDLDAKKTEERKAMIDQSPTPEVVPALN